MIYKGIIIVLVVCCALLGWQVFDSSRQQRVMSIELTMMREHTQALERQVLALEEELHQLEGETIEGMVEEAQEGLLKNWEELIEIFQDELGNLKDKLREDLESASPSDGKRT